MNDELDWENICCAIVDALRELCEQHSDLEEGLGGFDNITNTFIQGQLFGQQAALLAMANVVRQLIPTQPTTTLADFYLATGVRS